jgi:hypothetical protein
VRAVIVAAMVVGLMVVFILLPRWQEQHQNRVATDRGMQEVVRSPAIPSPADQGRASIGESASPTPIPTSTPTSAPVANPAPSRHTPRPQESASERRYVEAMSEGLAALENRQWQAAQAAFERASRLRPDAPEVADGMARARAGRRREIVADNLRRAREFERGEAWHEAEKMYSAVLAMDPESAAALAGQQRTDARATLDEKLEFHLANPGRLSTATVFDDATTCLGEAMETVPSGPRLEGQIMRLEAILKRASTPVAVVLESDALTEVLVYRVGRLGTFTRRELSLKPGAYTVVGSRAGFRDVRLQLVVTPGSPTKPLVVRCTERL